MMDFDTFRMVANHWLVYLYQWSPVPPAALPWVVLLSIGAVLLLKD